MQGKPYVFPLAYAYQNGVLYGQTTAGRKIEAARETPLVCLEASDVTGGGWERVMCWGRFEELDFEKLEPGAATTVIKLLTERIGSVQLKLGIEVPFLRGDSIEPGTIDGKKATLFRIVVTEKSGRRWRKG